MSTQAEFYEQVETYERPVARHKLFIDAYLEHRKSVVGRPVDVLDVGCGEFAVLSEDIVDGDNYFGIDMKQDISVPLDHYASIDLDQEQLASAFPDQKFDVIFCGEVIEHVFGPDRLLRQLATVMREDSLLVLSTPNLAYWVNRILLPLGISPLFVENSAEVNLGRRFKAIGQGNPTQGHLRLFTHRAMLDLIEREKFRLQGAESVSVWKLPGDQLIANLSPKLGPNSVFYLKRPL